MKVDFQIQISIKFNIEVMFIGTICSKVDIFLKPTILKVKKNVC